MPDSRANAARAAVAALLPPLAAFVAQALLWPVVHPFAWLFFYPAVFASSWFGGLGAGVASTACSTLLAWWFFVDPVHVWLKDDARDWAAGGMFVAMCVVFSLLHERLRRAGRLAEQALAHSRDLVELAPDGIFIADLDGRYADVNSAGCRMLGYRREELVGKTIMDLLPPEDLPRLAASRQRLLPGREVDIEAWRLRRKDGTWLPVEVSAKVLPDGRWQGFVRDISERVRMERALRESHDELVRAQAVTRSGSWRLNLGADELVWSDETYRVFGVPPGTPMTYERFLERVHPDDRARVRAAWDAALAGAPYDLEHRIVVGDEVKWVREKAELAFEGKVLVGGIGTVQDVTDRKASEEALRKMHEEELRLRRELERVTAASVAVSDALAALPQTGLQIALKAIVLQAQALTGASYCALGIGNDPEKPFDPWLSVGFDDATTRAIGRPPRPVGTLAIPARDGKVIRERDIRKVGAYRGLPPHHPVLTSLLGVPITYRGRPAGNLYLANKKGGAEFTADDERVVQLLATRVGAAIETAQLYESESLQRAWLQTMFDQMPEGVFITDAEGRIVQSNRSAQAFMVDTGRTDAFGNPQRFDVRTPEGRILAPEELPSYRALKKGENVLGLELALVGPKGRLLPVLASAAPVKADGRTTGAIAVFQDIRTIKELERLREEWGSVVAHDLRQPVSVIGLAAELLLRGPSGGLSAKDRATLERIKAATARLNRMIGDLSDVSRIEARRLSLERRARLDVGELVSRVVDDHRAQLSGFALRVQAAHGLAALVDADRIEQVLVNLLTNAVKYGEPGTPIDVAVRAGEEDDVVVSVTNRGRGIPPERLPLLFTRFSRTPETKGIPGLGLGLYIAHGLVEAHGGRIWAESTPGKTTTFSFSLPLAAGPEEPDGGPDGRAAAGDEGAASHASQEATSRSAGHSVG